MINYPTAFVPPPKFRRLPIANREFATVEARRGARTAEPAAGGRASIGDPASIQAEMSLR